MSNEITGSIIKIGDIETFPSGFTKREVVIEETEGKYPQKIKFEFAKDKCSILDRYNVGDIATVSFNIRGNEYNGKYYVSLQGWRIDGQNKSDGGEYPSQRYGTQDGASQPTPQATADEYDDSEIPF